MIFSGELRAQQCVDSRVTGETCVVAASQLHILQQQGFLRAEVTLSCASRVSCMPLLCLYRG